jgi:hypothetical protein
MLKHFQIILFLVVTLFSKIVFGQQLNYGSLKGRILDKDNNQPIGGALVILSIDQVSVISDSLGFFEFKKVKPGNYAIQVRLLGYENQLINDINVLPNKSTFKEINLQDAINTLEGVEVKAFKYENNRVTPISSYSFSREEISLNPGSQGDIFRAIGMLPGVSSSESSQTRYRWRPRERL